MLSVGVSCFLFIPGLPLIKTHIYMKNQGILLSTVIYIQGKDCGSSVKNNRSFVKLVEGLMTGLNLKKI